MCASWVAEARRPVANGTWTNISNFYGLRFRKEINTKWSADLNVLTPIPPQGGQKLHYDMEKLTDASLMEDLSGSGNHGTITGTVDVAGKYARARSFNGSSDFISTAAVPTAATDNYTMTCWMKAASLSQLGYAVYNGSGNLNGYGFGIGNGSGGVGGKLALLFGGIAHRDTGVTWPDTTTYHFVAMVRASGITSIYYDGVLQGTTFSDTPNTPTIGFAVGKDIGGNRFFNGSADEPYIYNRALSASEIIDIMNASLWDLLQNNHEVRFRETVAAKEWFRGRIRDRTADEVSNLAELHIMDNAVLMADAKWSSRRTFAAAPASVLIDELVNSTEGEPRNGCALRLDMESFILLSGFQFFLDLSGNGNVAGVAGSGGTDVTGKWGLGRNFSGTASLSTTQTTNAGLSLDITGEITIVWRMKWGSDDGSAQRVIVERAPANSGYAVYMEISGAVYKVRWTTWSGATPTTFDTNLASAPSTSVYDQYAIVVSNAAGTGKCYKNGVQFGSTFTPVTWPGGGQDTTRIGGPESPAAITFSLDEVYVYNRPLTVAELNQLASKPILAGGVGAVDSFTSVGFRADDEQRLYLVDTLARAVAGEWYVDRDGSDKDRMNLVARVGSASPQDTFQFGVSAILKDRQYETETVINDWIAVGNDGTKQLKSRNFQATTLRTTLTADLTAAATTATVANTTGFPSTGNLYIGMERVNYTGKTATTFTGLTRAYEADRYSSYAAYAHSSGIEVWLHSDNDATPDNYYAPHTPQNDSSIKLWGFRSGTYTDQYFHDQGGLDRLAQRLSGKFKDPRESAIIDVYEETVTCDIGDAVTVNDENAATYFNSPYRVFALEYDHGQSKWTFQLGNYRDTFDRRVAEVRDDAGDAMYYAASAATTGTISHVTTNATVTTTTEKSAATTKASGIRAGQKVMVMGWVQLTLGTGTTGTTTRVRRGTTVSGALVGEGNLEGIFVAVGSSEQHWVMMQDVAQGDDPDYNVTIQQAGASGNGTIVQASISVLPIG